jgi:hypothetical protein
MTKENLGRNGLSVKANTNAEESLDIAADPVDTEEVEAIAQDSTNSEREDGNPTLDAATQHPKSE